MSNPIAEASPDSLEELFSRDPKTMSDEEFLQIIKELRVRSAQWAVAKAKGAKRAPKVAAPETPAISLEDLGL